MGLTAGNILTNLAIGNEVYAFLIIFAPVLVGLPVLTLTRWWWAYALAALLAALMFLQTLTGGLETLLDPSDQAWLGAAFLLLALVATIAGISSALRARRTYGKA